MGPWLKMKSDSHGHTVWSEYQNRCHVDRLENILIAYGYELINYTYISGHDFRKNTPTTNHSHPLLSLHVCRFLVVQALRLGTTSMKVGQITNLMAVDAYKLQDTFRLVPNVIVAPVMVIVGRYSQVITSM